MGELRVISGKAKGMKLKTVPGNSTRPVTDRVKESLFNILGADVIEANFFDLFAGTGAIGIEALSRGCKYCRLLDLNREAITTIQDNLRHTHLEKNSDVIKTDTLKYLMREPDKSFDILYVAPPQYKDIWIQTLTILDNHPAWLSPDGYIVAQIHPVEYQETSFNNFVETEQRKYGSTMLVFYEQPNHPAAV